MVRLGSARADKLTYKTPAGTVANELLYRQDETRLEVVAAGRPWSFDGDGALFRLVSEAQRIRLAHLFDPLLAVHTSVVDPLPHQISRRVRDSVEWSGDASVTSRSRNDRRLNESATRHAIHRSDDCEPLEIADEQQLKISTRMQTRPAQPVRVEDRAQPFHEGVKPDSPRTWFSCSKKG